MKGATKLTFPIVFGTVTIVFLAVYYSRHKLLPDFTKEREALHPNARINDALLKERLKEENIEYRRMH